MAAVAFFLRNKGYRINYSRLAKELNASGGRGTDLVEIVNFFKNKPEFEAKVKNKSGLDWVGSELKKGRVCLVAFQNWQKPKDVGEPDWGHYGVIYEIEGNKVHLFDPGEETGFIEYSKEEFLERWYEDDLGVHYPHWAMSLKL